MTVWEPLVPRIFKLVRSVLGEKLVIQRQKSIYDEVDLVSVDFNPNDEFEQLLCKLRE